MAQGLDATNRLDAYIRSFEQRYGAVPVAEVLPKQVAKSGAAAGQVRSGDSVTRGAERNTEGHLSGTTFGGRSQLLREEAQPNSQDAGELASHSVLHRVPRVAASEEESNAVKHMADQVTAETISSVPPQDDLSRWSFEKSSSSAVAAALSEYRSGLTLGAMQRPAPTWMQGGALSGGLPWPEGLQHKGMPVGAMQRSPAWSRLAAPAPEGSSVSSSFRSASSSSSPSSGSSLAARRTRGQSSKTHGEMRHGRNRKQAPRTSNTSGARRDVRKDRRRRKKTTSVDSAAKRNSKHETVEPTALPSEPVTEAAATDGPSAELSSILPVKGSSQAAGPVVTDSSSNGDSGLGLRGPLQCRSPQVGCIPEPGRYVSPRPPRAQALPEPMTGSVSAMSLSVGSVACNGPAPKDRVERHRKPSNPPDLRLGRICEHADTAHPQPFLRAPLHPHRSQEGPARQVESTLRRKVAKEKHSITDPLPAPRGHQGRHEVEGPAAAAVAAAAAAATAAAAVANRVEARHPSAEPMAIGRPPSLGCPRGRAEQKPEPLPSMLSSFHRQESPRDLSLLQRRRSPSRERRTAPCLTSDSASPRALFQTGRLRMQESFDQSDEVRCQSPERVFRTSRDRYPRVDTAAPLPPESAGRVASRQLPIPKGVSCCDCAVQTEQQRLREAATDVLRDFSQGSLTVQEAGRRRTSLFGNESSVRDAQGSKQGGSYSAEAGQSSLRILANQLEPSQVSAGPLSASLFQSPERQPSRYSLEDSKQQENTPDFGNVQCGKKSGLAASESKGNGAGPLPLRSAGVQASQPAACEPRASKHRSLSWGQPLASVRYCPSEQEHISEEPAASPARCQATSASKEALKEPVTVERMSPDKLLGISGSSERPKDQGMGGASVEAEQLSERLRAALSRGLGHLSRLQALAAHAGGS
eukprot:TRINITY_DN13342_c0_g1_i1.p1 TRINITY_DN13342_c0_g1~~TRINITY_DN13342_c0_g1_i1.p1  ORF type:complete len:924 (+),score=169.42 TRINITY_DN13342_c0_g1_i1:67-2838(+)